MLTVVTYKRVALFSIGGCCGVVGEVSRCVVCVTNVSGGSHAEVKNSRSFLAFHTYTIEGCVCVCDHL